MIFKLNQEIPKLNQWGMSACQLEGVRISIKGCPLPLSLLSLRIGVRSMFGIQRNVQPRTRLEPPSQQQVPCNLFNEIFKIVTPLPIFLGVPTNVVSQLADRLKIRRNYVGAVLGGAGSYQPEPPIVSHSSKPKEEPHQSTDWVSRFTANHNPYMTPLQTVCQVEHEQIKSVR